MMRGAILCCLMILGFSLITTNRITGQDCNGGEISTKDSYLHGRFEVAMQSASGDGIVSSFFLYNIEVGCNWPEQNNEIDIEMTGNTDSVYFTTHHPGPWYYGDAFHFDFNPHDTVQEYAIEWEPGIVRWFVADELIYVQDEPAADDLIYPMGIMMNLWAGDAVSWVGEWDPSVMPRQAKYDYVKFYSYTPGEGNSGTDNNFSFEWEDNFDSFDETRWNISAFVNVTGNYCTYRTANVDVSEGYLYLTIDEPQPETDQIPVTFSVNMSDHPISESSVVYVNGSFNDWCGTCAPMTENNGVWSTTLYLTPGRYDYVYSINNWEETGSAPLGSECDFSPCDEWANYGFLVPSGSTEILLDTYCWGECTSCPATSIDHPKGDTRRQVIKICDLTGREVHDQKGRIILVFYDDGTVEKHISLSDDYSGTIQ